MRQQRRDQGLHVGGANVVGAIDPRADLVERLLEVLKILRRADVDEFAVLAGHVAGRFEDRGQGGFHIDVVQRRGDFPFHVVARQDVDLPLPADHLEHVANVGILEVERKCSSPSPTLVILAFVRGELLPVEFDLAAESDVFSTATGFATVSAPVFRGVLSSSFRSSSIPSLTCCLACGLFGAGACCTGGGIGSGGLDFFGSVVAGGNSVACAGRQTSPVTLPRMQSAANRRGRAAISGEPLGAQFVSSASPSKIQLAFDGSVALVRITSGCRGGRRMFANFGRGDVGENGSAGGPRRKRSDWRHRVIIHAGDCYALNGAGGELFCRAGDKWPLPISENSNHRPANAARTNSAAKPAPARTESG